jgi:hypothetical protein
MYYCARFTAEGLKPGAADVAYLNALVPGLYSVAVAHLTDGLVAYRLNLGKSRSSLYTGDLRNYDTVQKLYAQLGALQLNG